MAGPMISGTSTAPDPADAPPPARRTNKRMLLLAIGGVLLVLAAGLIGGLVSSNAASKKSRPAPAAGDLDAASIIDALMVANDIAVPSPVAVTPAAAAAGAAVKNATTKIAETPAATPMPTVTTALDAVKAMFGGGGSTARPMPALLVTTPTADGIPAGAVITQSWKQLAAGGTSGFGGQSIICYPVDGKELEHMTGAESPCNVLVLRNGPEKEYMISRTLNVSTPKVIIGTPVMMPIINGTQGLERLFDVRAGGKVDIRFVTLVRGFGRQVGPDREIRLAMGTIALIRVGGYWTASGCMLRERPNRASNFIEEVRSTMRNPNTGSRNIGQLFLALGGNIRLTGCRLMRFRPFGNGVFLNVVVGNDVLVVAGNGVLIGCLWYSASLFSPGIWRSGNAMAVLGGTGLIVGGAMYGATCAQLDISWGAHLLVGAGVLVTVGWGRISANLNLVRINGGQFSAVTGAFIQIGLFQARAWAVASIFGPGQSYANCAGLYYKVLSTFASFDVAAAFMGVGGSMYLGAGSFKYISVARVSAGTARTTYGCGSTTFNGGGGHGQVMVDQLSIAAARWMAGVGSDWFLGGGWATTVNHTRFGYNVVNGFTGYGGQSFVGLGGAVWIRSHSYSARVKNWNSCPYTYTVAGMGTRKTRDTNYFIAKNGMTEFLYNKTTKEITKLVTAKTQKTPPPTSIGGGKGSKSRRLPVRGAKPTRRYVQADPADLAKHSWLEEAVKAVNALPFEVPNKAIVLSSFVGESTRAPPEKEDFHSLDMKKQWNDYMQVWTDALQKDIPEAERKAMRRELRERPAGTVMPGKISANNSDCFLCRVGPGNTAEHVGGPDACEVNDRCSGDSPLQIQAAAQEQTSMDLSIPSTNFMPYVDDDGQLQNSDVTLLWHELTVYCHSTDDGVDDYTVTEKCLTREFMKSLVQEYMGADLSKLADVAVSEMTIHPAARQSVADLDLDGDLATAIAPEWNPECQGWSKYNVYVTTTYPDVAAALKELWAEIVEDPTTFSDNVVANADPEAELQPCLVTLKRKTSVTYPSLNKMPAYKPSREAALAPALTVGSATAIVPVESLVAGRNYTLFVQNFPQNSEVRIVLKDGTQRPASALEASSADEAETVVATVAAFDDDANGVEAVSWTAPHLPGKWFLQAFPANAPALFATSGVFTIVDPEAMAMEHHEEHIGQRRRVHRF